VRIFFPGSAQHIPLHWSKAEGFCNESWPDQASHKWWLQSSSWD